MKLPTISVTKGFLMSEIMVAFVLMTLLLTSAVVLSSSMNELRRLAVRKLERLEWVAGNMASTTLFTHALYGNDTVEKKLDPITITESDYITAWGRDTCDPRLVFSPEKVNLYSQKVNIGAGNASTDVEVRNGIAYISSDSATAALPDFYILDVHNPASPLIISSINTGPGLAALEVAGPYAYAANLGTTNQLQIIDISNRAAPSVVSKFKLPLPQASSTPPLATAIFYSKGYIYIGTEKWEGNEFSVIDVHIPTNPVYVGGFETNTLINNIFVRDGLAYVAASDVGQMRILNISQPASIFQISQFSPTGWETQQGKTISYFEGNISLGRTSGGFNIVRNHEIFAFSTTTELVSSADIPSGVYGIVDRPEYKIIVTHFGSEELQVWNKNLDQKLFKKSLGFLPQAMTCDNQALYFATGDGWGIGIITLN